MASGSPGKPSGRPGAWRGGRQAATLPAEQIRPARIRYAAQGVTVAEVARALEVCRGTIYRVLRQIPS
ncbi:helix-turn-helix domain-containing protein [Streptosporangium sp. CA-135522]|uniref:helix-turn-helix domain-containing protein n=1 Tax=Streptosporangium sp. CA-135522 TaxID=3240072 RepID=UPI003D8A5837